MLTDMNRGVNTVINTNKRTLWPYDDYLLLLYHSNINLQTTETLQITHCRSDNMQPKTVIKQQTHSLQ